MGNLLYACVQLVHNIGVAAVVGSPAVAWWLVRANQMPAASLGRPVATAPVQRKIGLVHTSCLVDTGCKRDRIWSNDLLLEARAS